MAPIPTSAAPRSQRLARLVLACVVGVACGVASAGLSSWLAFRIGGVRVGSWSTNVRIGHHAANPWLRAAVALGGLLALDRRETLYYTAFEDDDGRTLSRRCRYRVEGAVPPARWWSITAYAADGFLIPNRVHRYSVGSARVRPGEPIAIRLAPRTESDVDLPLGDTPAPGSFSLTLRLYEPASEVVRAPERVPVLAIRRTSCE